LASPIAAQRPQLEVRAGVVSAGTLVEDVLATSALRTRLGTGLGEAPVARSAAGPELEIGARVALRGRAALSGLLGWQFTTLQVEDAGGQRDAQDLSVLHGILEAEFQVRGPVVVSGAAGALAYLSEERGLFADGADVSPLLRFGVGGRWALGRQLLTVRALADAHQFGNAVLRAENGSRGGVLRYGLQLAVVPGGAR